MRSDVAILYVDSGGCYPALARQWYDEQRDADRYKGLLPVVAHPPCGPYSRLRKFNKYQKPHHAVLAVGFVRRCGGVLEHPAYSLLWDRMSLPKPGEPGDEFGGYTIMVERVRWGHLAKKPTWLYIVGARNLSPIPPMRQHTHLRRPLPPHKSRDAARDERAAAAADASGFRGVVDRGCESLPGWMVPGPHPKIVIRKLLTA